MTTPKYRNDRWTLDDELGFGVAGDTVASMVLETEPPFTLGVAGKWGSGKTSVLRRAFVTLGGQAIRQDLAYGESKPETDDKETWDSYHFNQQGRVPALNWDQGMSDAATRSLCIWYSPW